MYVCMNMCMYSTMRGLLHYRQMRMRGKLIADETDGPWP